MTSVRSEDPVLFVVRAVRKMYSLWVRYTYPFAAAGRDISIHYPCVLSRKAARHIKFGSSVILRKDTWVNILPSHSEEIKLTIEDNCSVGYRATISAKNFIHLERDVIVSASVLIQDHNHAYEDINLPVREQGVTSGGRIRIEEGCWIGQGAAIVCGDGELVIGRNSVVGANAVVTRSFPPYSVIVGSPARVVKQYDAIKRTWSKRSTYIGNDKSTNDLLEWETEQVCNSVP